MADKEKIRDMLDNFIADKGEQAQVDFHDYLAPKMQEIMDAGKDTDTDTDEE